MQPPRAVVFDLGKVLLEFDYNIAVRNMIQHCRVTEVELLKIIHESELLSRYETGLITTAEFYKEVCRLSSFCRTQDEFEPMFGDIFKPVPEMIALNDALREASIPTFIFSNTNDIAIRHIRERYPFFANFHRYILSYEHGAMKPSPAIYEVVEKETGATGPGILYIDDRLENVQQGAARGWRIIHHSSPAETIPQVRTLLGLV